jgi:BMFP domain-containing protein YqiC
MSNPQREIEQRAKAVFERCVALDLVAREEFLTH